MTIKYTNCKKKWKIYTCSRYTKYGKEHCTQHSIKYQVIYDIVLERIRAYAKRALKDEQNIVKYINKNISMDSERELNLIEKLLLEYETRLKELTGMMSKLYEDSIKGKIGYELKRTSRNNKVGRYNKTICRY